MNLRLRALVVLAGVALASPALAHHSFSIFDVNKTISIQGTIQKFLWSSPHSWIDVIVPKAAGQGDLWSLECGAPALLARNGWTKTSLKPGDKVTIDLHPLKTGRNGGACVAVTLPDGTKLGLGSKDIYQTQRNVQKSGPAVPQ